MSSNVQNFFGFYGCQLPEISQPDSEYSNPLAEMHECMIHSKAGVISKLEASRDATITRIRYSFCRMIEQITASSYTTNDTVNILNKTSDIIQEEAALDAQEIVKAFFEKKFTDLTFAEKCTWAPIFTDSPSGIMDLSTKDVFSWLGMPFPSNLAATCEQSYSPEKALSFLQEVSICIKNQVQERMKKASQDITKSIDQLNRQGSTHYNSSEIIHLLGNTKDRVLPKVEAAMNERIAAIGQGIDAKIEELHDKSSISSFRFLELKYETSQEIYTQPS